MRPILLIDNFDSFTYNVLHGLVEAGASVEVRRRDQIDLAGVRAFEPSMIVLSPGPGRPEDAGVCLEIARTLGAEVPILGICLGLQVLAVSHNGKVGAAPEPVHGKSCAVTHDGRGLFEGLASPVRVGRYHSLCVTEVPPDFEVCATTEDGTVMAFRHRRLQIAGVQFHPDSFLTEDGGKMLWNAVHGHF
ncbi:MAG TPA: aminodeoxychorismate/anthranilate synthase component II [Candidatus Limnocylindrales bacterium]